MQHAEHEQGMPALQAIPIDLVNRNLDQPRKTFDVDELDELADSIQSEGLMLPITVRPDGEGGYQIVVGERRWRAFCILKHRGEPGYDSIACHVKTMDDLTRDISANYICAEATFMEGEAQKRAGIFIGPEFGTVSRPDLVAAAREADRGEGDQPSRQRGDEGVWGGVRDE